MRAIYTIAGKEVQCVVIATHTGPDGPQVDLAAREGESPFILRAPVAATPSDGFAVLTDHSDEPEEKPRKPKK